MANSRFKAFGLTFDNVTLDEAVNRLEYFINDKKPHMVFTTGAELIVRANQDTDIRNTYLNSDLLTVDSRVVYYSCKLLNKPILEPVSAVRLMFKFLENASHKGYRLYFLGAKEEVLNTAVNKLKEMYPKINIVGYHHGYFPLNNDAEVVNKIKEARPDIVFVAMSSPLKEKFISKNILKINVPVTFGVGGSVDVLAGYCKLAPFWISRIGLEWLYRFIQEPKKLWRRYLVTNFLFVWLVIKESFNRNEKNRIS